MTGKATPPLPKEERDLSRPHCARICSDLVVRGSGSLTTIYLQNDETYSLADGTAIDIGQTVPVAGPCAVRGRFYCFNSHGGAGGITLFGQSDGTFQLEESDETFIPDETKGHLTEGRCPVPARCCWNPHTGPERTVWAQLDGTYNTAQDGSGDTVDVAAELGNLTDGRCKPVKTLCFFWEREIESLGQKGQVSSEVVQECITLYQHDDGTYLDGDGNEFAPTNPPGDVIVQARPDDGNDDDSETDIKGYFVDGACAKEGTDPLEKVRIPYHYQVEF